MTGNELKELLSLYRLTQKKAAEIFGVTEVTMSKQVNMGDLEVSTYIKKKALTFAVKQNQIKLVDASNNLTELVNQLLGE